MTTELQGIASGEEMNVLAASASHLDAPEFSICIPQYNRTPFLIEACRSIAAQSFISFEVCISDDCSTDGREEELISFLRESRMDFTYARQARNRRYDGNLRGLFRLRAADLFFCLEMTIGWPNRTRWSVSMKGYRRPLPRRLR